MELRDIFWLSYKDLSERKVRTALTVIMVMIGVASIIALTSLTAGIGAAINNSLQSLGPTSVIVTSARPTGFTLSDTAEISSLPNVSVVIPILTGSANLLANGQNTSVTVIGIPPSELQYLLGTINMYEGTVYGDSVAPASVIGYSVAFPSSTGGNQNLGVGKLATLQLVGRGAQSYTLPIVGVLQSYGSLIVPIDTGVIMSLSASEALLHRSSFNLILVKASNASSVAALSSQITAIYGSNARVVTTQQIAQTAASIVGSISVLLLVIAGISLLVAAIGIMNIMLMAVLERTHEIGIMKSIGFKSRDVLTIFLVQALMIGLIGGIIGILVGASASYGLAYAASASSSSGSSGPTTTTIAPRGGGGGTVVGSSQSSGSSFSFSPVLTPSTVLVALLVAMIVSVIAGLYPAWRAAKMEPIEALRSL